MPNWCMNSVTITGSKEKLEEIVKACEEDKFLEYLVPIGEWDYGTAVESWGTKWEARDVDVSLSEDGTELSLNFDTAWGPPVTAYETAEETHDITIEAHYYEPGMAFVGQFVDGMDEQYEIDFENEDWRDEISQDAIDHWDLEYEYENWKEMNEDWEEEEEEL